MNKEIKSPVLCEGCGYELTEAHIIRCGLPLCKKCVEYDDQESENEEPLKAPTDMVVTI